MFDYFQVLPSQSLPFIAVGRMKDSFQSKLKKIVPFC